MTSCVAQMEIGLGAAREAAERDAEIQPRYSRDTAETWPRLSETPSRAAAMDQCITTRVAIGAACRRWVAGAGGNEPPRRAASGGRRHRAPSASSRGAAQHWHALSAARSVD